MILSLRILSALFARKTGTARKHAPAAWKETAMAQAGSTGSAGSRSLMEKATSEYKDLTSAAACAAAAGILLGYVAGVAKPGGGHLLLALVALAAIVWAYMLVGRSQAEAEWKAGTIIGSGVIGLICLLLVSALLR
jgi:FtsH-binding integral membrane protein